MAYLEDSDLLLVGDELGARCFRLERSNDRRAVPVGPFSHHFTWVCVGRVGDVGDRVLGRLCNMIKY